jgi:hypothetical protein
MASFISALSLFILVLSNGCFTLPILDEQFPTSTYSSMVDGVTTGETFNLRSVNNDLSSDMHNQHSTNEFMGFDVSTFTNEPMAFIHQEPFAEKREYDDVSFTTVDPFAKKREYNDVSFTTVDPFAEKREYNDLSFTTVEPTTEIAELGRRSLMNEFENETEYSTHQMKVESTTKHMLQFTSTSSAVTPELYTSSSSFAPEFDTSSSTFAPKFYTSSSSFAPKFDTSSSSTSTSTSTKKYIGLLKDQDKYEEEYKEERPTKYIKYQRKPSKEYETSTTQKSEVYSEEKSPSEDSKDSLIPTAIFDQQALDQVSIPNDFLIIDEGNDLLVTGLPNKIFPTTMAYKKEAKPLNQGKKPAYTEEKESNY